MSLKLRFVNNPDIPNIGFTEEELLLLDSTNFVNPESLFKQYLLQAGKKSNVFDTEFKDVETYRAFQEKFRVLLRRDVGDSINPGSAFCFQIHEDFYGNKLYYFTDAGNAGDPQVNYFSEGSIPDGANFRDDRCLPIGLVKTEQTFAAYLNYHTANKFGEPISGKIKTYLLAALTFPIWVPILLYLKMREIRKGYSKP